MTSGHEPSDPTRAGGPDSGRAGAGNHGEAAAAHGATLQHGTGHDAVSEELGPVDYGAWTAGIVGVALGLLTAACFALATAPVGR